MKVKTLSAVVCGALLVAGTAHAERIISFAHAASDESHPSAAAKAFGETLDELSGGEFVVRENCCGSLGGERDMIEGLQIGSTDVILTSSGPMGNFEPATYVFDLPFVFSSYEQAYAVLDGPIGQEILGKLSDSNIIGLAWADNGFRHLTNSRNEVHKPSDVDGMTIRTMENEIHMEAFRLLGARPTPMPFPEVFTALQQGAVDAQENPLSLIISSRFFEAQEHLSLTGHVYSPGLILASPILWDRLSEEEQGWVTEAAQAGAAASREHIQRLKREGVERLRGKGMTVITDVDIGPFQEQMQPVYESFREQYGDEMLDRILAFEY